jgi:RHS repeat-associated protein
LITVTQNAQSSTNQTRRYYYDGLSRLTQEVNPESGTTNYYWDAAAPSCGGGAYATPGDLGAKKGNAGVYTCYGYDALHRIAGFGPSTNTNCTGFQYDSYAPPTGVTVQNPLGRMVEAYTNATCNGHANLVTDKWFSYSPRGEVTDIYTKTTNSGGFYHMTKSYWANGAVEMVAGIPGVPTITYGADGEGRPSTVSASSGQNPVTQTLYNAASQVTSLTYGSGDSDTYQYDSNTGRMTQYSFNVNGSSVVGKPAWNSNGTLLTLDITDPFNSANQQNCTYGYDALARVNSVGCGSAWAQTFTYDPFGNITKSGSISWMPGYNTANNHYTLGGTTYDNDGNLTADTFHTYQWDPQGHPVVLDNINSLFDALGNLAEQDAPTWNQEYLYDENHMQIGSAVGQTTGYAYVPLPGGEQVLYSPEGSLPTLYIHADWLGSARLHSTQSRTVYGDTAFAPFGETYANSNTSDAYHFAAYPLDFALGLYDTAFREYHTTQGRWLTPDPSGLAAADPTNPQSWNRYAYVSNNPLSNIDPLGLDCIYLNNSGTGLDPNGGVDTNSNSGECGINGGYWVDGTATQVTLYNNNNDVSLQGVEADSQGYLSVSTDAYYTNVTASDQSIYTSMGIDVSTGTTDIIKAFKRAQLPQIGPISPIDRTIGCAGQAGASLAKDLTGIGTVQDLATALATGSFQPLVNVGDGLDVAEKAGTFGSRLLSGAAAKVAGGIGKVAGPMGKAYSATQAAIEFGSCEGW